MWTSSGERLLRKSKQSASAPNSGRTRRVVLAPHANDDIRETLAWSEERFGALAAQRYAALLKQALRDIAADPVRPGSLNRNELLPDVRSYPIVCSRERAQVTAGRVRAPRHIVFYRIRLNAIEVIRVLHDARDFARHIEPS